jgi:hypothetical protein
MTLEGLLKNNPLGLPGPRGLFFWISTTTNLQAVLLLQLPGQ